EALRSLSAGADARAGGFSFAPGQEFADFRARAAVSAADGVRRRGAGIRRRAGSDRTEIQHAGAPRNTARIRTSTRGRADHADSCRARWRTQDVKEPG